VSQSIRTQQSSTTPSIYAVAVLEFSGPLTRRTPGGVVVISCIVFGCARRVPSPRIFGRGSQGAATDAAAWAGRKSETAAPRRCLQGVGAWGRHLQPDGNGWNRSIRPMLCIGEMPAKHVCWAIVRIFALAAPVAMWVLGLEAIEDDAVRQRVAMGCEPSRNPLSFRLARPPSPVPAVACEEGDRQPVSPANAGRTRTRSW
jgi:hypothetical protein